jgi:hypothetical protein
MSIEEFLSKVIAQLMLSATVRLIEWLGSTEYAQNVVHAIHERCRKQGNWVALQSAVRSLLRVADPSPRLTAGLVWATGYLVMAVFYPGLIMARIHSTFGIHYPESPVTATLEVAFVIQTAMFLGAFGSRLVMHFALRGNRWGVRLSAATAAISFVCCVLGTSHAASAVHVTLLEAAITAAISVTAMVAMIYLGVDQVGRNIQPADFIADRVFKRWEGPQSAA